MIEGSAVAAMTALRMQFEERLMQNEDFRAFKALDRAIADVQGVVRHVQVSPAQPAAPAAPMPGEPVGLLQQRLAERFDNAAA